MSPNIYIHYNFTNVFWKKISAKNKELLETQVLELYKDVRLEPSIKCELEVQKNLKGSKFGLISLCPDDKT